MAEYPSVPHRFVNSDGSPGLQPDGETEGISLQYLNGQPLSYLPSTLIHKLAIGLDNSPNVHIDEYLLNNSEAIGQNVAQDLHAPSFQYLPHPHSSQSAWTVSFEETAKISPFPGSSPNLTRRNGILSGALPWASFRTRPDFEYTESAVKGLLGKDIVNMQLQGMRGSWSRDGSHITLRTNKDMEDALDRARARIHQVMHHVSVCN